MTKRIGIYQIKNIINGKIYIGSSVDIDTRWTEHKRDLRMNEHRNKRLQNSYNKYGANNFVYEILELLESKENLYTREQWWLDNLNACDKNIGYNIQNKVLIPPSITKKVVCLETNEVFNSIKDASKKYNIDSSSISCCCHKRKVKQAGGYHWIFYNEYVKLTTKDIQDILLNTKASPIICLEDLKIYRSWKELPYKKGCISRCCRMLKLGNYATCDGKKYMFLKDYNMISQEELQRIKELKPNIHDSGEIICLETGCIYKHARNAMLSTGVMDSQILNVCYHKAISAGRLHWLFLSEYNVLSDTDIQKIINTNSTDGYSKSVVCLETKNVYKNSIEASKDTSISVNVIRKICKNKGLSTLKKTFHFMFLSDYKDLSNQEINDIINTKLRYKHVRKVLCVENGRIYESVTEAAKSVHDVTTNISKCCKHVDKTCKGFHWRYF